MARNVLGSADSLYHDDEYRYEPLIAEDAVRVLVVEPADQFDSPLCCSITQHRRELQSGCANGCEYSAVSYTWGSSELSHQLLVRADAESWSRLRITANVDSLLRHFRVPHKARMLWIDAICLNQKDDDEKTQQIPLMGQIYNDAKRVLIWLGNDQVDEAQHAFEVLREIGRRDPLDISDEELQCLVTFFNRPWFTRRWVIQEAVFSHDAVLHCGIHKLSLSRVMSALGRIKAAGGQELVGRGARMLLTSLGSRHVEKKGLLSLLWDFHDSECSDPRDRIAAVYTLVTDGAKPSLQYGSRKWREIYMDVASYFIENSPEFDPETKNAPSVHAVLLHLCHFGPIEPQTDVDCPSWVPDWSRRRHRSLPYNLDDEPSEYSRTVGYYLAHNNIEADRILSSTAEPPDSAKQDWDRMGFSLHMYCPACMDAEVIGKTLRFNYKLLVFFQNCGKVDLVIRGPTRPEFWHEVNEALGMSTSLANRSAEMYDPDEGTLLKLLAQLLVKLYEAAGKDSRSLKAYREEIVEALNAHRDDPEALNASHGRYLRRLSRALSHVSIVSIQASTQSYWAIGPPAAETGDWMMPLVLPQRDGFAPMICLRTIGSEGAGMREPQRVSSAAGIEERCLRFLGGSITELSCLHVKARFVGLGSHCDERKVEYSSDQRKAMLKVIVGSTEAARNEGLPGPVVFDIV